MAGRRTLGDVITPWRVGYTVALAVAALLLIVGFQSSKDQRAAVCAAPPIIHLLPCPGDSDLRQGLIGVTMPAGYDVALIVDQTEIPPDQLRTGDNQFFFQPGPGTETGALAPGAHSATVIYWPATSTREAQGKSYRWQFGVT